MKESFDNQNNKKNKRRSMEQVLDSNFPGWMDLMAEDVQKQFNRHQTKIWEMLGDFEVFPDPFFHLWINLDPEQQHRLWKSLPPRRRESLLALIRSNLPIRRFNLQLLEF